MLKRDTSGRFYITRNLEGIVGYKFQSGDFQLGYILSEIDYQRWLQRQQSTPAEIMRCEGVTWWMFKGNFYCEDEGYTADEVKLKILEFEMAGEGCDEKMDTDFLNSLPMDDVKEIVSYRNRIVQNLYNDAKKEYDDWVLKGKSAVEQAAKELLEPGEDIRKLEKFMGKIPTDFIGGDNFESSPVYKKWRTRIEEAKKKLEKAKKILGIKARERFGFPDIPEEQEESTLTTRESKLRGEERQYLTMSRCMYGIEMAGNALSAEVKRSLNLTISYPCLRVAVTQHVMFNFFAKPAIALKEIL